jgi:hypothetical protein
MGRSLTPLAHARGWEIDALLSLRHKDTTLLLNERNVFTCADNGGTIRIETHTPIARTHLHRLISALRYLSHHRLVDACRQLARACNGGGQRNGPL